MQGLLELLDVAVRRLGRAASAVCMDKLLLKDLMAPAGIPQVAYGAAATGTALDDSGFPCWVKPARLGSSVGHRARSTRAEELRRRGRRARASTTRA